MIFLWLRPSAPSPALRRWRLAIAALLTSLTLWSFSPVTRADWSEPPIAPAEPGKPRPH